jgi:gamma-butyrobetaine dioxygenase
LNGDDQSVLLGALRFSPDNRSAQHGGLMDSLSFHVEPGSTVVNVVADGKLIPLSALWLRERCQDVKYLDAKTQQRLFDPHTLDPDVRIVSVKQLDPSNVHIGFSDGYAGNYPVSSIAPDFDLDDGLPSPHAWKSDLDVSLIRFANPSLADPAVLRDAIGRYLQYGALILTEVPTESESILQVAETFGHVRVTNFGKYFDVMSKPESNDLAYRSVRLGPHTDNPYRNPVPGIQLLHCLVNETTGGYSTLVDSLSVIQQLADEDPGGVDLLSRIPVKFRFVDQDTELIERRPMIELDHQGRPTGVHYSPRLDYLPVLDEATTVAFHRARRRLGELFSDPAYELYFRLQAGELMMFDNNRVLHGRTEFDPREGLRHLQGCYIDLDGPRGRYLNLQRFVGR